MTPADWAILVPALVAFLTAATALIRGELGRANTIDALKNVATAHLSVAQLALSVIQHLTWHQANPQPDPQANPQPDPQPVPEPDPQPVPVVNPGGVFHPVAPSAAYPDVTGKTG